MLDRCEETLRRTGRPLLAWLKSHAIAEPSPRPFSFLGTQQARSRYRRTWKQFITFALRVFRLGPVLSQEILHLVLQPQHYQQLEQIWDYPSQDEEKPSIYPRIAVDIPYVQASKVTLRDSSQSELQEQENVGFPGSDEDPDYTEVEDDVTPYGSDDELGGLRQGGIVPTEAGSLPDSGYPSPPLLQGPLIEMLFKLCVLLMTQTFKDGQPHSSVLVYFSGALGISSQGGYFLPARLFTSHLSALIYIQRLLFLEYALPYKEYSYLGWHCRPSNDHFTQLETVRRRYMLPGSLTALGEFQSLRFLGKQQALLDPPSFFLHWSPDGSTVSLENVSITLDAFRALPEYFIRQAEEHCNVLLLNMDPTINLSAIQDSLTDCRPDQSFVSNPVNQLQNKYLLLASQAASQLSLGLIQEGAWQPDAVHQYLLQHEKLLESIAGILMTASGQVPRLKELYISGHSLNFSVGNKVPSTLGLIK
ncbi:hypothetical protein GB937_010791 [Aspergillus fischeri]|nr:hypothetical protein GB937_010791 [Aspergillus fischeri]